MKFNARILAAAMTTLAWASPARAMFAMPDQVPVDRLVANIEAYVKEHPRDAQAKYLLGRAHFLAIASKTGTIAVWGKQAQRGKLPRIAADTFQGNDWPGARPGAPAPAPASVAELARHVRAAAENFRAAIALDSKEGLYHLSLGSLLESTPADVVRELGGLPPGESPLAPSPEGAAAIERLIEQLGSRELKVRQAATAALRKMGRSMVTAAITQRADLSPEMQSRLDEVLKGVWADLAIAEFHRAFELSREKDLKIEAQPLLGLNSIVSYEAATRYLALTSRRELSAEEKDAAAKMQQHIKAMTSKPPGPITPIVLSLERAQPLSQMIDTHARVRFDLDSTGRDWGWDWVRPETGLLVWDPSGEGKITSGRQLFGNVTFGLMWRDGYEAMSSLDDNRDGQLSGRELAGLAIWFDRDGDGRSDPGEVTSIERAGVASLSCRATGTDGASPMNAAGLRLSDGRVLPTYDWVAKGWRKRD